MSWLLKFFTSSIGSKLLMSLTGLFLILFLVIHLVGNLQLLANDNGEAFNIYAYTMTHNPMIKMVSYVTYLFIGIHMVVGIAVALKNRKRKGKTFVKTRANASTASKNMALLGTLILAFLVMHMGDFWWKMKMGDKLDMVPELAMVSYDGFAHQVLDLYTRVSVAFENPIVVLFYVLGQIILGLHLWHGFGSAFQSLGLNHKKYTPIIKFIGAVFSIVLPLGFAAIPLIHYFN